MGPGGPTMKPVKLKASKKMRSLRAALGALATGVDYDGMKEDNMGCGADLIKIVDLSRKSDMEIILHIASAQSAIGMFKPDQSVAKLIGEITVERFKKECESKSIDFESCGWTALIIAFVEKNFQKEKDTWELFIQKASDWLSNKSLEADARKVL